jgi:DHA2 family multidrug resistance protein
MSQAAARPLSLGGLRDDGFPINPWVVAFTVTLATFMEVLDTSIANVSLPHIAGTLSATSEESTWVLTSYLVSNAVVLPLSGWLSGMIGRKRFYNSCVLLFTISSALCGMASSLGMLVFFRVLQGIGGGGLQPSEQAILVDTFPAKQRGMGMAIYTIAILVAPVLGPTLGGWITDNYSWRWIFYINVPVGCLSLMLTQLVLRDPPYLVAQRQARRGKPFQVDFIGLGLIAIGLATLEIVLDKGQELDWFSSHYITGFSILAVVALIAAVVWELRHPQPIVNLRLFRDRNFAVCCVLVFCIYAALYASTVLLPQMLQTLMGYSATKAGMVLSPGALVTMLEMPIVGFMLTRGVDPRRMIMTGLIVIAMASFSMSRLNLEISPGNVIWLRIVQVLGAGMMFVPINTVVYRFVPRNQTSNASGLYALVRNEGSSIGVATVATVLQRNTQVHQAILSERVNRLNPNAMSLMHRMAAVGGPGHGGPAVALRMTYAMVQRQAAMLSYMDLYRMFSVIIIMVVPLVLLMRRGGAVPSAEIAAH